VDEKDLEKAAMLLESTIGLLDDILSKLSGVAGMLQTNDVGAIFSLDTVVKDMKHVKRTLLLCFFCLFIFCFSIFFFFSFSHLLHRV
jgi:hypothetical protein